MKGLCFNFLKDEFPKLYNKCIEMEDNILNGHYETALILSRPIGEFISKDICERESLNQLLNSDQFNRIEKMYDFNLIDYETCNDYHKIRSSGNNVNHKNSRVTKDDAYEMHESIFNISSNFYKKYTQNPNPIKIGTYPGLSIDETSTSIISEKPSNNVQSKLTIKNNTIQPNKNIENNKVNSPTNSSLINKNQLSTNSRKKKLNSHSSNYSGIDDISKLSDDEDILNEPYFSLSINEDGKIIADKKLLNIKVEDIKNIVELRRKSYSFENIGKRFNTPGYTIKRLFYNYMEGNLEKLINNGGNEGNLVIQSEKDLNRTIRKRPEIPVSANKPYKNLKITPDGHLKLKNDKLRITILDVKAVHEAYNEGLKINKIGKKYHINSSNKLKRIIVRYDAGDFNEVLIKSLKENPSNKKTYLKIKNNTPFNLRKDEHEDIFILSDDDSFIPLRMNQADINFLIEKYKNNVSIKSLSEYFNMTYDYIERIINRILAGDFNKIPIMSDFTETSKNNKKKGVNNKTEFNINDDSVGVVSFNGFENDNENKKTEDNLNQNLIVNKDSNNLDKEIKEESIEMVNKDKSIDFGDEVDTYSKLNLMYDGTLRSYSTYLKVKVYEIEPLFNSFKNNVTVESLSKQYNGSQSTIKKIINNYELGIFDIVIEEWKQIEKEINFIESQHQFKEPIRERIHLAKSQNNCYGKLALTDNGHMKGRNKELDYTILNVRDIHESYNEGIEIDDLINEYKYSASTINRIIGRYDAGDFENCLTDYLIKYPSNKKTSSLKNNTPFKNIHTDDENNIFIDSKEGEKPLGLSKLDINILFEEYENNRSIKSLSNHFKMNYGEIERIINRIIAKDFEEIISKDYEKDIINNILKENSEKNNLKPSNENKNQSLETNKKQTTYSNNEDDFYKNLSLKNDGRILTGTSLVPIKVYEIEDLYESYKNKESLENLSKQYEVSVNIIKKILNTYQTHKFNTVIREWKQKEKSKKIKPKNGFKDHIRERPEINKSLNKPYNGYKLLKNGQLKNHNELKFTILQARNIHEQYNEGENIEKLMEKYSFTESLIRKIIVRYDAGDFKKLLKQALINNPSNKPSSLEIKNNTPFNLEMDKNENIFNINEQGKKIPLKLKKEDILILCEEYNENRSIKSLSNHFKIDYDDMERIINRKTAGDFSKILSSDYKPLTETQKVLNNNLKENEKESDLNSNNFKKDFKSKISIKKTDLKNFKYSDKIIQLNNENEDLKVIMHNISDKMDNLTKESEDSSIENSQKIKELEKSLTKINDLENELNKSSSENLNLKASLDALNNLKSENLNLKAVNNDLESELNKLSSENLSLRASLDDLNNLKSENINLKAFNKNKVEELKQEKNEIEKLNKELQEINQKYNNLKIELINKAPIKRLDSDLTAISGENNKLKLENAKYLININELKLENESLKHQKNSTENNSDDYQDLKIENNQLYQDIEILKNEKLNIMNDTDRLIKSNENLNNILRDNLSKTQSELQEFKNINQQLIQENEKLKLELKSKSNNETSNNTKFYGSGKNFNKNLENMNKGVIDLDKKSYDYIKDQLKKFKTKK